MSSTDNEPEQKKTWSYYYHYSNGENMVKSHHIIGVLVIVGLVLLFHFRHRIAEAHDRYRMHRRVRYSSVGGFEDDLENGLNSNTFDIESNILNSDTRAGLLQEAKEEIKKLMTSHDISFDEARLQYTQSQLNRHGINKDGLPSDPRLVTF